MKGGEIILILMIIGLVCVSFYAGFNFGAHYEAMLYDEVQLEKNKERVLYIPKSHRLKNVRKGNK